MATTRVEVKQIEKSLQDIFKYSSLKPYEGLEGHIEVVNGNTHLGIEIELEHYKWKHTPDTWNVIKDDSLKLDGQELVSIPLKFKYLEVELDRLIAGTTGYTTSSRCSVHVHVNVRDFTSDELKTFLGLYLIFEKSLFRFSGNRWNNNYCTPLFANPETTIDFWYYNYCFSPFTNNAKWYKYAALNLCPIWGGESKKYGTAEFRHMNGNLDKQKIMDWCNLIVSLKIAAKKMPLLSLLDHIKTMNTTSGYGWLATEVFGSWSKLLTDEDTFKEDVESCITKTKFCVFDEKGKEKKYIYDTKDSRYISFNKLYTNGQQGTEAKVDGFQNITMQKPDNFTINQMGIFVTAADYAEAILTWNKRFNYALEAGHTEEQAINYAGPKPKYNPDAATVQPTATPKVKLATIIYNDKDEYKKAITAWDKRVKIGRAQGLNINNAMQYAGPKPEFNPLTFTTTTTKVDMGKAGIQMEKMKQAFETPLWNPNTQPIKPIIPDDDIDF